MTAMTLFGPPPGRCVWCAEWEGRKVNCDHHLVDGVLAPRSHTVTRFEELGSRAVLGQDAENNRPRLQAIEAVALRSGGMRR